MTASDRNQNILALGAILLAGFAIRLILFLQPYTINPDGVFYIQQAQAIAQHDLQAVTASGLSFVSTYTVLIAATHALIDDWLFSARLLSLLFGTLTLVPIFLTATLFFDKKTSAVVGLAYAMIPAMVTRSVDVVRDPTYWFFMATALYLATAAMEKENPAKLMLSSSLFFLLATLTRIEAIVFWGTTFLFLCATPSTRKRNIILPFIAPVAACASLSLITVFFFKTDSLQYIRLTGLLDRLTSPFKAYSSLRAMLRNQIAETNNFFMQSFLVAARRGSWILALGFLFNKFLEAFFYPYACLSLLGLCGLRQQIKNDKKTRYFVVLIIAVLVMLYLETMRTWVIEYRYMANLTIPCLILVGYGITKLSHFFCRFLRFNNVTATVFVAILAVTLPLPYDLSLSQHADTYYKEIGTVIAKADASHSGYTSSFTSSKGQPIVTFYANHHKDKYFYQKKWASTTYTTELKHQFNSEQELENYLQENSIQYFLWEDNFLPPSIKKLRREIFQSEKFKKLGSWQHKEAGEIYLFQIPLLPGHS